MKCMTQAAFLKALKKKVEDTKVTSRVDVGLIRLGRSHCPLSFITDTPPCHVELARRKLHMSHEMAEMIMQAADNYPEASKSLRKDLLKAVGLC